jgi:hypothetical protein
MTNQSLWCSSGWRRDGDVSGLEDPFVQLVAAGLSAAVLVVAFGLLAAGVSWFWVAFPVGYGAVLPLGVVWARGVAEGRVADRTPSDDDGPAASLRAAYVAGDIDEAEFEAELERVLRSDDRP